MRQTWDDEIQKENNNIRNVMLIKKMYVRFIDMEGRILLHYLNLMICDSNLIIR